MARPKKENNKIWKITVRFTEQEKLAIVKNAKLAGVSESEVVRAANVGLELKPRLTAEEAQWYRQLIGIANNLNQLTKAINSGEVLHKELLDTVGAIKFLINKLR